MARIPKPKKPRKQRQPVIIEVPLTPVRLGRVREDGDMICDACGQVPAEPDEAMLGMGVTDALTLAFSHLCKPCFETVEWGKFYAPVPEIGAPVMPLGQS